MTLAPTTTEKEVDMERQRTIAAAPVRSAAEAWQVVSKLLTDTLERSPAIPVGSVAQGLAPLSGLGPVLIAGGHLESKGLVLVDVGLHLTISVMTADAALNVVENLNPVPGGAGATEEWILHLPQVVSLETSIKAAANESAHLSSSPAPTSAPPRNASDRSSKALIDLEMLRKIGTRK